jgi:hypothetical protein
MQKWTFLGEIGSKNDQSFCHVHNVMIQKKLHIPGEMDWASLEMDEPLWYACSHVAIHMVRIVEGGLLACGWLVGLKLN